MILARLRKAAVDNALDFSHLILASVRKWLSLAKRAMESCARQQGFRGLRIFNAGLGRVRNRSAVDGTSIWFAVGLAPKGHNPL